MGLVEAATRTHMPYVLTCSAEKSRVTGSKFAGGPDQSSFQKQKFAYGQPPGHIARTHHWHPPPLPQNKMGMEEQCRQNPRHRSRCAPHNNP